MIYSIVFLAASAATVAAQAVSYNSTTGAYTCNLNPNGAYCASDSLGSPIIIRCTNGVGQPGNCNDNTAGYYPVGNLGNSLCWETSNTSGDAACEKNCIVEGSTGNYDGTFTLPGCTPAVPSTSASATATSTTVSVAPTTTTTAASSSTTITSTGTTTYTNGGVTTTEIFTFTTVVCPATSTSTLPVVTFSTSAIIPLSTGGSSSPGGPVLSSVVSNGTAVATSGASGSATATPVGPTTSSTPLTIATGSAMANSAGAGLAAIGLFIAYFM